MAVSPVGATQTTQPPQYAQTQTTDRNKDTTQGTSAQAQPAPGTGQHVDKTV